MQPDAHRLSTILLPAGLIALALAATADAAVTASVNAGTVTATGKAKSSQARARAATATAPETSITSGPPDFTQNSIADFEFTSDPPDGATFACRLDDQAGFAACVSPHSVNNLGEGEHTLRVRATQGGATDDTPATRTWTVDRTAPDTTITKQPDAATSSGTARFEFESPSGEPVVFRCSLGSEPFQACESPVVYTGLGEGAREFRVRARDRAGNVDDTPASASWTVDTSPPETFITQAPNGLSNHESAEIKFVGTEGASAFQCSTNGADFVVCTSPWIAVGLHQGTNAVRVRALDAAGNADPTPVRAEWTVDSVAPDAPSVRVFRTPATAASAAQVEQPPQAIVKPIDRPLVGGTAPIQLDKHLTIAWHVTASTEDLRYRASVSYPVQIDFWRPEPGGEVLVAETAKRSTTFVAAPGDYYCFDVAARDPAGNWSKASQACTEVPFRAKDLERLPNSKLTVRSTKKAYLGQYVALKRGGLKLDNLTRGVMQHVSLVATRCPTCGTVIVTVGFYDVPCYFCAWPQIGTVVKIPVNLRSAKTRRGRLISVWSAKLRTEAESRVTIERKSGTPRIEGLAVTPD